MQKKNVMCWIDTHLPRKQIEAYENVFSYKCTVEKSNLWNLMMTILVYSKEYAKFHKEWHALHAITFNIHEKTRQGPDQVWPPPPSRTHTDTKGVICASLFRLG